MEKNMPVYNPTCRWSSTYILWLIQRYGFSSTRELKPTWKGDFNPPGPWPLSNWGKGTLTLQALGLFPFLKIMSYIFYVGFLPPQAWFGFLASRGFIWVYCLSYLPVLRLGPEWSWLLCSIVIKLLKLVAVSEKRPLPERCFQTSGRGHCTLYTSMTLLV